MRNGRFFYYMTVMFPDKRSFVVTGNEMAHNETVWESMSGERCRETYLEG